MCGDEIVERKPREPKTKSAAQAFAALQRLAARSEKSSGDAMRLMQRWGVPEKERRGVLAKLVEQRFIDDRRYAEAYVREKSRLGGWGARKIALQLRSKGISQEIIKQALGKIDGYEQRQRLEEKLRRKLKGIKAVNDYELRGKLLRYALSLGYDYDTSTEAVQSVID